MAPFLRGASFAWSMGGSGRAAHAMVARRPAARRCRCAGAYEVPVLAELIGTVTPLMVGGFTGTSFTMIGLGGTPVTGPIGTPLTTTPLMVGGFTGTSLTLTGLG